MVLKPGSLNGLMGDIHIKLCCLPHKAALRTLFVSVFTAYIPLSSSNRLRGSLFFGIILSPKYISVCTNFTLLKVRFVR
jgi:hypothetical protein